MPSFWGVESNIESEPRQFEKRRILLMNGPVVERARFDALMAKHRNLTATEVTATGVGIAPKNKTRIFGHGFTTWKEGHGFGLHSAALAATELGGSLTANSDGCGRSATFILELSLSSHPVPSDR